MPERTVVTIDGLAGSGKTTISELLAKKLGYAHLNSGLLYRGIAWLALSRGLDLSDANAIAGLATTHTIDLDLDAELTSRLVIDGQRLRAEVYTEAVSEATSIVASHGAVRSALIDSQRRAFPSHNLVAEGRDMGTVIFPDAPLKFFVSTALPTRVQRRLAQIIKGRPGLSADETMALEKQVEIDLEARDKRDSTRLVAPTKPAEDAIMIDNSSLPLLQVIQNMYDIVAERGVSSRL